MLLGGQPGGGQNPGAKQDEAAEHTANVVRVGIPVKVPAASWRSGAGRAPRQRTRVLWAALEPAGEPGQDFTSW